MCSGMYKAENKDDKNKIINTIIEIRKDILIVLRKKCDNIDRLIDNESQQSIARQEIREIAEMVSEKDSIMEKLKQLNNQKKCGYNQTFSLIYSVRDDIIDTINSIKSNIVVAQYDEEELEIVYKELKEFELMIKDKDRLVASLARGEILKNATSEELSRINPHLSKYFCMDDNSTR